VSLIWYDNLKNLYHISEFMIPKQILERIDEKRKLLNKKRPLSRAVVEKLREQLAFEMTFNSNAIEGNQLTLKETYLVIQEGITVKGKPL
ncbi:MAG: hypothetical protein ACKOA8_20765, partial [Deltaproteobacteria bacterium]